MRLSPAVYDGLQSFVHGSYSDTIAKIVDELELKPGDRVVEIGCGTAFLGKHFVAAGYDYWGVDPDPDRIAAARKRCPEGTFLVGSAETLQEAGLARFDRAFIHGVLHHVDDSVCRTVIGSVMDIPGARLVVVEPFLPKRAWLNPFGYLLAKMDEGKFVRKREDYLAFCTRWMVRNFDRSLMPRWPVPFLHITMASEAAPVSAGLPARP